jgi:IQ calmodulin-binding motif
MQDQTKFLEDIKSRRNERHKKQEIEQEREVAALIVQKTYRGWLARTKFRRNIL